jgi:hypothetical protein
MDRFQVVSVEDAQRRGLPEADEFDPDDYRNLLYDFITDPPAFVQSDGGEPEDNSFHRDWAWVVKLLNQVNEGK